METLKTKVLIIGSGPAGYTAGIYTSRANLKPILIQGIQPGGQLTITTEVENYPGFAKGILGPDLMMAMEAQARHLGTEIIFGNVDAIDYSKKPYVATINDGEYAIEADTLIICTGAAAKWLGIPSETKFNGYGVSACAVCDGFFFKNQKVAVVGAGDTAAEEALYLSKMCTEVHLIVRRDTMRASKIMQDRILNTANIIIHWNSVTDEILGDKTVHSVRIKNVLTSETTILEIKGFFVAIGHTPNNKILVPYIDTDEDGYVKTKAGTTQTNLPGVFAAGDIQDKTYRQAITAAGSGCMAALEAERYLMHQGL